MRYVISDDVFFLSGVMEIAELKLTPIFIPMPYCLYDIQPAVDELVILAISDSDLRKKIMQLPGVYMSRLLLIVDIPVNNTVRRDFPWVLSKSITIASLVQMIIKAEGICIHNRKTPPKIISIFNELCKHPIAIVSQLTGISSSHLYLLRNRYLRRYGLEGCNAVGYVLCRDILQMKMSSNGLYIKDYS